MRIRAKRREVFSGGEGEVGLPASTCILIPATQLGWSFLLPLRPTKRPFFRKIRFCFEPTPWRKPRCEKKERDRRIEVRCRILRSFITRERNRCTFSFLGRES